MWMMKTTRGFVTERLFGCYFDGESAFRHPAEGAFFMNDWAAPTAGLP